MGVRRKLSPEGIRFGLTVFSLSAIAVFVLTACSDSDPEAASTPAPSASAPSSAPIPTASTPSLTPLPTPSKPWPTPKVTGEPENDAPLAERIQFAIAKQAQIAAGKTAATTVKCPGMSDVEKPGKHELTCTVTYGGKAYTGTLTVDAKTYTASYKFTSESVAIVKPKVVDAVLRAAPDAAKVTCTMDDVAVVKHSGAGIACDVTSTTNAVQPYKAQVSGNGQVLVAKA
ncbi:hypothetical protein EV652_101545 [Kribbella steppae]|uniref:DUF4333 domain-containing protein n=1 Tax=Kribbella steppae TaxID=2512223 RepID=A0A4V2S1B3_9ACTN|nr:hypothetical protein [Kribbella steppae]TCO35660.1 hypothetical protein EV652_101545 [Kribbella steppae]